MLVRSLDETPNMIGIPEEKEEQDDGKEERGEPRPRARDSSDDGRENERTSQTSDGVIHVFLRPYITDIHLQPRSRHSVQRVRPRVQHSQD